MYIKTLIEALYNWTMRLAGHKHASVALFAVAFAESSFFPIPPHAMLVPMVLAKRAQAWKFAAIATVASVLGGLAGYLIGYGLFDVIGKPVLEMYGAMGKFDAFRDHYNQNGAWIVFFGGATPVPYKVITIASGVTSLNLAVFLIASIASRGLVFFAICALLYIFGEPIREFIEKRLGFVFTVSIIMIFAGIFALKYIMH